MHLALTVFTMALLVKEFSKFDKRATKQESLSFKTSLPCSLRRSATLVFKMISWNYYLARENVVPIRTIMNLIFKKTYRVQDVVFEFNGGH